MICKIFSNKYNKTECKSDTYFALTPVFFLLYCLKITLIKNYYSLKKTHLYDTDAIDSLLSPMYLLERNTHGIFQACLLYYSNTLL